MINLALNFLWQTTPITPTVGWLDILWMLVQTAIALGLVCGLAILIFRYILPKLNVISYNKSIVRVVDGASLDARKRLLVVEVAGKYLLLASSESGVQFISGSQAGPVRAILMPPVDATRAGGLVLHLVMPQAQFLAATDR